MNDGAAMRSPLARRDPAVKLALLLAVSVALLFVFDPLTPAILYGLALAGALTAARIPLGDLARGHVPFVGFALGVLVVNALSRPGTALVDTPIAHVTVEGLRVGAGLAMRVVLVGLLSAVFVATTDPVRLMASLRHIGLGERVTYALLAGYRLLQDLPAEWRTVVYAQAVRAPLSRRTGRPRLGVRTRSRAVFALLVVSVRRSERLALALESRGLGLRPRTTWRPVRLTAADGFLAVGVLLVLGAALAASAALGHLRGVGALGG